MTSSNTEVSKSFILHFALLPASAATTGLRQPTTYGNFSIVAGILMKSW